MRRKDFLIASKLRNVVHAPYQSEESEEMHQALPQEFKKKLPHIK